MQRADVAVGAGGGEPARPRAALAGADRRKAPGAPARDVVRRVAVAPAEGHGRAARDREALRRERDVAQRDGPAARLRGGDGLTARDGGGGDGAEREQALGASLHAGYNGR